MDPTQRAIRAYFRSGGSDQPAGGDATVEHEGKDYVVLRNVGGILAVYRILTNGGLRRLHEWPGGLEVW